MCKALKNYLISDLPKKHFVIAYAINNYAALAAEWS